MSAARVAAIFDLDDTLLTESSGRLLFDYLRRTGLLREYFRRRYIFAIIYAASLYKLGIIDATNAMLRGARLTTNIRVDELWVLVRTWFDEVVVHAISADGRAQVEWHRAEGHIPVICSASSQFSVCPVADYLGIEHTIYTDWLSLDGRLTGFVREPVVYGAGKVHWMEAWATEHNVSLADSYFYSDHISDRPLLERVAHPNVINPNRRFARVATALGWPVEYWR